MLDPRLYRASFVAVLLAVLVAAFSIENPPRPIGTTIATDVFDGDQAMSTLDGLARGAPDRRPGDAGDERLAQAIADELRGSGPYDVRLDRFRGETIDGERDLVNVVATRTGAAGPGLVVIAHRDSAGVGARAELSGTAALLELARVTGIARLRRTLTFVSTTGGSGGFAGARRVADQLRGPADAVIVLGDLASAGARRPLVVGWSNGRGQASLQLRRTVEAAVRVEAQTDPGGPRPLAQWARLAIPVTVGEQGVLGRAGQPAVLLSVSGERGPAPDAPLAEGRLEAFGRAALRTLYALDNGPLLATGPHRDLVMRGKVVPGWAIRLLVGTLLLPPLLAAIDGVARARRRHEAVEPWVRWTVVTALPFAAACVCAKLLSLVGVIEPSPPAPIPSAALDVDGGAIGGLAAVAVAFALAWAFLRPAALSLVGTRRAPTAEGAGLAVLLTACLVAAALWVMSPFAAVLLVPAVHLWLFALAPGGRRWRPLSLALVVAAVLAPVVVLIADAQTLDLGALESAWFWLLLLGGGHIPAWSWLLWSLAWGCGVAAALVVLRRPTVAPGEPEQITVRGPLGYAGPGSLGGTESALRR